MSNPILDIIFGGADGLPPGRTKAALLEHTIREADAAGDVEAGIRARMDLIECCEYAGLDDKAIVAFSWCLAQYDARPELFESFEQHDLLWKYKWILGSVLPFPAISRERIEEMCEDYACRLERAGYSRRSANYMHWRCLREMGDAECARRPFDAWQAAPRDEMADCNACEGDGIVAWHLLLGDDQRALEAARPILAGHLFCACVPEVTHAQVLSPLIRLGRREEADDCHRRGYRRIAGNADYLREHALHLHYVTWRGDARRGVKILEQSLPLAAATAVVGDRCRLYWAVAVFLESLVMRGNRRRKLMIPADLPCRREDDSYKPAELAEWFRAAALATAARFDERNGNDSFTRGLHEARALALAGGATGDDER
ncbi:MAG: hypothetical protein WD066_12275 [Planctomycetaceae bacterium]